MKLYVGNHILNLDAITFVDLRHSWDTEEWTYKLHPVDGLMTREKRRSIQHTGVRINFVDGKSVTIEDLPDAPATLLRDYLLSEAYDLGTQPAPLSLQDEILAGLPAELTQGAIPCPS